VRQEREMIEESIPRAIELELELAPDIPKVESDRTQMQQILMSLAMNAAEAIGDQPGNIRISTGVASIDAALIRRDLPGWPIAPGDCVYLEVRDTGCGMDEAIRSRIFEPVFSTKCQGRGLGLAAVAGIVRTHKGAIHVTTARGAGSTFRVLFPAAI
jgi:signal transduction histidine kinase